MALAAHNYLDSHLTFPSGSISLNGCDINLQPYFTGSLVFTFPKSAPVNSATVPPLPPTSIDLMSNSVQIQDWAMSNDWPWQCLILPQMDLNTVIPNFRLTKVDPYNWQRLQIEVLPYTCPSAPLASNRPASLAYTSYRACMGWWPTINPTSGQANPPANNGMFYQNSRVSERDVTDGLSNTFMFGESMFGGFLGDGYACCARARDDRPNFDGYWTIPSPTMTGQMCMSPPVQIHFFGFGSYHNDTSNFALGDGSVKAVEKGIDTAIFRAICTRNGNEPISASSF